MVAQLAREMVTVGFSNLGPMALEGPGTEVFWVATGLTNALAMPNRRARPLMPRSASSPKMLWRKPSLPEPRRR